MLKICREDLVRKFLMVVFSFLVIGCFIGEYQVMAMTLLDVQEEYQDDEQYQKMVEDFGEEYGRQFCGDVLRARREELLRGGGGNICYQYVTNIMQNKTYNCGSASVLQNLYGLGTAGNVPGTSNNEKMNAIDAAYNVDAQGCLMVYQVRDALNTYSGRSYIYEEGSTMTQAAFADKVAASLTNARPVILHAETQYIWYYGGEALGHYISLDYINRSTQTVRLVDCNYMQEFYGVHDDVTVAEAYMAISGGGRYIIR